MRVSVEDPRRMELIPETDIDRGVIQDILDKKAGIYWGDAGDNLDPPELLGGLVINTYPPPQEPEPVDETGE